jgi:ADP-heptose:LPS heptosyltransferase
MKKRYPNKQKVLLVNITRLGDMLQSTPTIAGIKMENPDAHITVLVEKQFESICHIIPNIDRVIPIDLTFTCRALAAESTGIIEAYEYVSKLVDELKAEKFDYCLNMSSSAYTALLINMLGIPRAGGWTADSEGYRVIESEWARLFATSVHYHNRLYNSLNLVDIFRCSADVEKHPEHLLVHVEPSALTYADSLLEESQFSNQGPLIAVQAGASQAKRQWAPSRFVEMIKILVDEHNARVILTGAPSERTIVDPIIEQCDSPNVVSVVGRTSIPQLTALLQRAEVLITGDTGPMHIAVATGTPVISMFLASAYGFETGPYGSGNIVLQPVIGCGPCNPNKACSRPDCHDKIPPRLVAELAIERTHGIIEHVDRQRANPDELIVYNSYFDTHGFCDLKPLNVPDGDGYNRYRNAYRKLWLDELGGYDEPSQSSQQQGAASILKVLDREIDGLQDVLGCAENGKRLIEDLRSAIMDEKIPAHRLREINDGLANLDREIEELGFNYAPLGALTKMFVFAKENLTGSDAMHLASQMEGVYNDLARRCEKLGTYYAEYQ